MPYNVALDAVVYSACIAGANRFSASVIGVGQTATQANTH